MGEIIATECSGPDTSLGRGETSPLPWLLDRLRADGQVAVTVVDEVLALLLPRREVRTQLVSCAVAVLGRDPGCDRALLAKLQALVDADWAAQEPAVALEAWLRVVEVGLLDAVEGFLATAPGLFEVLDPSAVRVARPELMTRMRWAVADQGYELPDLWTRNLG